MNGARAGPLIALLLTVLAASPAVPSAVAGWSQAGGDAAHSGQARLGDLDVAAQFRLAPQGLQPAEASPPGLLETSAGLLTLARTGSDCQLVRIAAIPGPAEVASGTIACPNGGRLAGWDEAGGRALLCIDGTSSSGLLQSWAPGASEAAWTHAPQLDTPDPLALLPGSTGSAAGLWGCHAPAIFGGRAVVPFSSSEGRNRIESIALADGEADWSTPVPSSLFLDTGDLPALPGPVQDASGAFVIDGAVATSTGFVVSGRLDGTSAQDAPPGLAWLSPDGTLMGAYSLSPGVAVPTGAPSTASLAASSRLPAASGPLAAHLIGDALFVVNPANAQGTLTELGTPSLGQTDLAAPCWTRDTLAVPGEAAAFLVPSADPSSIVTWGGFLGGRLQACAITATSLWVATTRVDNGTKVDLVEVSLLEGRSLRRLPLPLAPPDAAALSLGLLPLDDGRLVVWSGADAVLLAPQPPAAAARPRLEPGSRFPAAASPADVEVGLPAGAPDGTRLLLAWGDGLLEDAEPGRFSHTYGEGGDRTVRLTAVYPDNTTATASQVLHVGAAPPKPRGLIEILFAPENQNYTFTAIGLLVTLIGAVVGLVGVHRGRHRLERHMAALDRIRDGGRREPFGAIRQLHDFHEDRRKDLAKGDLEDAQFAVLEATSAEVLELLRQRILGTFVGRVSDRFSHALDLALADGDIDEEEGAGLLALSAAEANLTAKERETLGSLVKSWQRVL